MAVDDKSEATERGSTDQSLRVERHQADAQLVGSGAADKNAAEDVVAEAREKADAVLSDARKREDRRLTAEDVSDEVVDEIGDERARADALLSAERSGADVAAIDQVGRRRFALARLLAFERHDTDMRLQIERTHADEALASRESILAIVSHDLRSLLGAIAFSADLLRTLPKALQSMDQVGEYAETIQRFSARMNRLIGDLIDVASIEAGKLALLREPHDVSGLMRDALEAFRPAAAAGELDLTCSIESGIRPFKFDEERILQVLTNLVGNALKFTPKGGRVSMRVEQREDGLCFVVEDTGTGIPPDLLEKVFDRCFQADDNDRRGLGLGLYIAKSIVESHGGRIWAESERDRGSRFISVLPAETSMAKIANPPRSSAC